jgi:hypothetical protein
MFKLFTLEESNLRNKKELVRLLGFVGDRDGSSFMLSEDYFR